MAEVTCSEAPPVQDSESILSAFHNYRWDLDKDFLVRKYSLCLISAYLCLNTKPLTLLCTKGGLVLALGGYHALAQTTSQADIIMHTRTFYFARIKGLTVPYAAYRAWLRSQFLSGQQPRIWEWTLLESLCAHRDKLAAARAGASQAPPPSQSQAAAAAQQKEAWMRQLLNVSGPLDDDINGTTATTYAAAPDWMKTAPKSELYIDRPTTADGEEDQDPAQVPYPELFAAIVKAVQSGEPVEGIEQIPDIIARNPVSFLFFFFLCKIGT